jgi:hypothetical protein
VVCSMVFGVRITVSQGIGEEGKGNQGGGGLPAQHGQRLIQLRPDKDPQQTKQRLGRGWEHRVGSRGGKGGVHTSSKHLIIGLTLFVFVN